MRSYWHKQFYKQIKMVAVLLLTVFLLLPAYPRYASAGQNPSQEEIAQIFDGVAQEKKVPSEILKAIAYAESGWRQWDKNGNVVANYAGKTPYLGIMQVGTYNPADSAMVSKLKNDIAYNIAYGAEVLLSKWDMTPRIGDGDKSKLENWYFAIWAYNSWSTYNNPNNAVEADRVAYQDKILKLISTKYYPGAEPVTITPISKELLPKGSVPSKNGKWETPQPIHFASFSYTNPSLTDEELLFISSVKRIAGTDRIDTALKIAEEGWPDGSETIVLAKSGDFPDALAGAALAKINNAPILLTPQNQLDRRVGEALLRLKPLKVIILGGEAAVSAQVENKLKEIITWTDKIERIAGKDRFETAAQIAAQFPTGRGAAITTGLNFPDALSLAAAAASQEYPLLLVSPDTLPQATADALRRISPEQLYIAGGEGAVSSAVLNKIKEITSISDEQAIRFAGKDRYQTSVQIIEEFNSEPQKIFMATGQNFPDALAGAALAANSNTPMLLIEPDGLSADSSTAKYLKSLPDNLQIEIFGGKSAISDQSIVKIKQIIGSE